MLAFAIALAAACAPAAQRAQQQQQQQQPATTLALGGLDPVALCGGTEVAGREDLEAVHFVYLYRFADADHRATFLADPERWCIQFGGGCGRMGPLSGRGAPDRWFVYREHIYIFASEQCRDAFRKAPERFALPAVAAVTGELDAVRKGRDACVRAAARFGATSRLARLQTIRWLRTWQTTVDGAQRDDGWCETIGLPDRARRDQNWGDYRYATVLAGTGGHFLGADGLVHPMHATGADEYRRAVLRKPIALLRRIDDADFQAVRTGAEDVAGRAADVVRVGWRDVATTLWIAQDDGTVLQQRTHERGPNSSFGDLTETFADFRAVDGLVLPHEVTTVFGDGKPAVTRFDAIELDVELPADFFAAR